VKALLVNEKGWFFGGVEQLVNDTAAGLSARGHEVHLVSSEPPPPGREPFTAPFASRARLELTASEESWRRQVARVLESASPDVVYVHRFSHQSALDALLEGRPSVRYVHDHDLYCPRRHKYCPISNRICGHPLGVHCVLHGCLLRPPEAGAVLPGITNLLEKRRVLSFNRKFRKLLVGSRWMAEMMRKNGFTKEQVEILPPIPRGIEKEPQPGSSDPLVLYVGQVIRGKGVDLLLEALSHVKQPFRAVVVGTGNHLQECIALVRKLELAEKVTFIGWVDHGRLGAYYAQARAVVVPSRWAEPFGMVGLEAMWASRPVVGFDVGGIPDWLLDGETGFVVAERDTRAFAHALDELLSDDALAKRMGAAGWERAKELYRHEAFIVRTEEILAAAVQGGQEKVENAETDRSVESQETDAP
jgi:glycosyltransferase involved in cell wall biosynthesis